jgi:hypothetical protein
MTGNDTKMTPPSTDKPIVTLSNKHKKIAQIGTESLMKKEPFATRTGLFQVAHWFFGSPLSYY